MRITDKIKSFLFYFKPRRYVALYKLYLGDEWLELSVDSIAPYVHDIVFVVSDIPWGGVDVPGDDLEPILKRLQDKHGKKIHIIKGRWDKQLEHVKAGLAYIKKTLPKATHCLYIDSDEVYTRTQIKKLLSLSYSPLYYNRQIRWNYRNYFKDIYHVIYPEKYPLLMVFFPLRHFIEFVSFRTVNLGRIDMSDHFYEHFAYARKDDEAIRRKIEAHRESEPIIGDWYKEVWLKWSPDMKNFHPTNPEFWEGVRKIDPYELPQGVIEKYNSWKNDQ